MALFSYTALLFGWLALFALLLFVLLFGEAEMFEGTVVERLHWVLTDGVPYGVSWVLRKVIGDTAGARIEAIAQEVLCERPNPAMQLIYVALVMGGYWVYCLHVEPLITAGAVSETHLLVVPIAMFVSIASWLAVCFSDPGVVDAHTLDAQLAAYPFDRVLYAPKLCPTLRITCPARSKFCRVTQRRVAKFDHYCGWMGNSIGENNLRFFVSFLGMHVLLTSYGAWLCVSAISGEIGRRGLWAAEFEPSRRQGFSTLASDWGLLAKFISFHFSQAATLSLFLVILALALGAFLGYHLWMIKRGLTTNETFKWKDYERFTRLGIQAAAAESDAAGQNPAAASASGSAAAASASPLAFEDDDERDVGCVGPSAPIPASRKKKGMETKPDEKGGDGNEETARISSRLFFAAFGSESRKKKKRPKIEIPKNIYDKGSFLANLREVLYPPSHAHRRRLDLGASDKKRN